MSRLRWLVWLPTRTGGHNPLQLRAMCCPTSSPYVPIGIRRAFGQDAFTAEGPEAAHGRAMHGAGLQTRTKAGEKPHTRTEFFARPGVRVDSHASKRRLSDVLYKVDAAFRTASVHVQRCPLYFL